MDMYSETSEEISAVAEVPKQKRAQHILASYCQATGTGTGTWDFLGLGTWDLGIRATKIDVPKILTVMCYIRAYSKNIG